MIDRLKALGKAPLQVASCLIFDNDGKLLLLRRHSDDLGGGMWAVPGGKQEPGEDPSTTAVREVLEESGLALELIDFLGVHEIRMPHGVVHMKTFMTRVPSGSLITLDPDEHSEHRWFTIDELLAEPKIIWALPTTLRDFNIITNLRTDFTLNDGSEAILLERFTSS